VTRPAVHTRSLTHLEPPDHGAPGVLRVVDSELPVDFAARQRALDGVGIGEKVGRTRAKLLPDEKRQRAPELAVERLQVCG